MADNSYAQLIDDFEKGLLVIKGESLTDYIKRMGGVDYDAKANGGLMYLKKGGKVVDIMPKSMSWKGKAKDYPGIHEVIKQNRKKKTGPGVQKKADGGLMSPEEYFKGKEKYMKEEQIENMRREYNEYLYKQKHGPRDEAANGGIMGYASGGGIQNLSDVYNNSSVLQDKYATQQDYLDLFDQNTTTTITPTTSTTTITDLIEQAPAAILPPRVNPLIIPQGGDSGSGGGITNIGRTNMNQPNAMGGKTPGFKAGVQRAFNDIKTAAGGLYDIAKYVNPLDPTKFDIRKLFKMGKEVFSNRSDRIVAEQKAIAEAHQEEMARREEDRIRSQSPTGSMNYGPSGYEGMSDAASQQEMDQGGRGSRG